MIDAVPIWIAFALVTVCLQASFLTAQKLLVADHPVVEVAAITTGVGALIYLPIVSWTLFTGDGGVSMTLLWFGVLSGFFNVMTYYANLHALKRGDLSIVAPIAKAYPLSVAVVEPLVLGTTWSWYLFAGAGLAVGGAYIILLDDKHPLTPIRNLLMPAVLFALLTALLSTGAVVVDRFALSGGVDLVLYLTLMYASSAGFASLIAYSPLPSGDIDWGNALDRRFLALGGLISVMTLFLFLTLSVASATQASTAFQLSVPLAVLLGGYYLDETGLVRKLAGSMFIVIGIVFVL